MREIKGIYIKCLEIEMEAQSLKFFSLPPLKIKKLKRHKDKIKEYIDQLERQLEEIEDGME